MYILSGTFRSVEWVYIAKLSIVFHITHPRTFVHTKLVSQYYDYLLNRKDKVTQYSAAL